MLIGEVLGEWAEEAREGGSEVIAENLKEAVATMNVVGYGLRRHPPQAGDAMRVEGLACHDPQHPARRNPISIAKG